MAKAAGNGHSLHPRQARLSSPLQRCTWRGVGAPQAVAHDAIGRPIAVVVAVDALTSPDADAHGVQLGSRRFAVVPSATAGLHNAPDFDPSGVEFLAPPKHFLLPQLRAAVEAHEVARDGAPLPVARRLR